MWNQLYAFSTLFQLFETRNGMCMRCVQESSDTQKLRRWAALSLHKPTKGGGQGAAKVSCDFRTQHTRTDGVVVFL